MAAIQRGPRTARSADYSQRAFADWARWPQLARKIGERSGGLYLDADRAA